MLLIKKKEKKHTIIMGPETLQITSYFCGGSCLISNYLFEIHQAENACLTYPLNTASFQMDYLV